MLNRRGVRLTERVAGAVFVAVGVAANNLCMRIYAGRRFQRRHGFIPRLGLGLHFGNEFLAGGI